MIAEPLRQAEAEKFLRQAAALRGDPNPRLLSGPEQDIILRELLAGHACSEGKAPRWPSDMQAALATRGFRTELRDLLMRAVERGLEAGDLAALGLTHDRPDWVAAAQVLAEYDAVTALSSRGSYDPASILGAAADLLETIGDRKLVVRVDRARARFSSWYEMFPRSCTTSAERPGTLRDCAQYIEYVADMGFDVLYLPPIHPIGVTERKGRNNSTTPTAADPGSPV